MKLGINLPKLIQLVGAQFYGEMPQNEIINGVAIDSRKIVLGHQLVYFALSGEFKDGHDFVSAAYSKGVRVFVVTKKHSLTFNDACFLVVQDSLIALQAVAKYHRDQFHFPIIAVTGSVGKTTTKEWLYHLLSTQFRIIRSPKSYNSQLGVALSLLELTEDCDIAIIEVGISHPGEMGVLEKIISPEIVVLTSIGTAHLPNFTDINHLCQEKIKLASRAKKVFLGPTIAINKFTFLDKKDVVNTAVSELSLVPFNDSASRASAAIAIAVATFFDVGEERLKHAASTLPRLAMRLETYEGINNNTVINDTYNLDLDALSHSLEFQTSLANQRTRVLIIGLHEKNPVLLEKIYAITTPFQLDEIQVVYLNEEPSFIFENAVILIKGTRKANMQKWAIGLRLKKHKTQIEVNLSALRQNLLHYKSHLPKQTKILVMVKAQAYGSGLIKTTQFIEKVGVDYLGVAYVDEGVELRKAGVLLPILVMNAEEDAFGDCIKYNLEPSIFSFNQLDLFIHQLIAQNIVGFPVHLKFDTGMNRLGFSSNETRSVIDVVRSQPEISIKSIYSHLAESDNRKDPSFTLRQLETFTQICNQIQKMVPTPFLRHILNSEGIVNFSSNQFEMARIGIGLFGVSANASWKKKLQAVITWKSSVSQIKNVEKGESIGYNRSFIAPNNMTIAIIPVGYGDGFKRSLSNGKGGVFIQGVYCPTVGNVCMDMIMVEVISPVIHTGDEVEIIGPNQPIEDLAKKMGTIPYELLTAISQRVHRTYINEE